MSSGLFERRKNYGRLSNDCPVLDPHAIKIGLRSSVTGEIEKGKILVLSDGTYRFIGLHGQEDIDQAHQLVVLFKKAILEHELSLDSLNLEEKPSYEPAFILIKEGHSYVSFGRDEDHQHRVPLKSFEYGFKDQVGHVLYREMRHLIGAVTLPCAGTALLVEAAAKTVLLPISGSLGLSKDGFSARAVGHDLVVGSLFFLKGAKSAVQAAIDPFKGDHHKGEVKTIEEDVLEPVANALLHQSHHHPHMQIVPPLDMFLAGAKQILHRNHHNLVNMD